MRDAKETREKKTNGSRAAIFFSRVSFASRSTDKAKEGLLVVYSVSAEAHQFSFLVEVHPAYVFSGNATGTVSQKF